MPLLERCQWYPPFDAYATVNTVCLAVAAQLVDDKRHFACKRAAVAKLHLRCIWNFKFCLHPEQVLYKLRRELVTQPEEEYVAAVEEVGTCGRGGVGG